MSHKDPTMSKQSAGYLAAVEQYNFASYRLTQERAHAEGAAEAMFAAIEALQKLGLPDSDPIAIALRFRLQEVVDDALRHEEEWGAKVECYRRCCDLLATE